MFGLKQRKLGGYSFMQPTFYGTPHKGTDYVARYNDYYSPFDGIATSGVTDGGGRYWQLIRPNGDTLTARHLDKVLKIGQVKEGDLVAVTGNTGKFTTGPHLHQEVKINGVFTDPEKYNWQSYMFPLTPTVQLVFNNQHYANEVGLLGQAKARMEYLSGSKVSFHFLPPLYTNHQNIPALIYQDGLGAFDSAVSKDWLIDTIYPLCPDADIIVFIGKKGDWQYQTENLTTFGHYYSTQPATFPLLIQVVAEETDNSWKWPQLNAFVHYLTHEVSHGLLQNSGGADRTHELDYASQDGLLQGLPGLDYDEINYSLTHKVGYGRNNPVIIQKEGDPTLYFAVADILVPFAADYADFLKDFKDAKIILVTPNEFLKFRLANTLVVKAR